MSSKLKEKPLSKKVKKEILNKAKDWWKNELAEAHKKNTLKLTSLDKFDINPFLWTYLAFFLEGKGDPESLAKVLIYPRILGTSISTSFGSRAQSFISTVFEDVLGSTTPGIDLEFIDKLDGRKKYCQIKAGPNVINRDDVITIRNHFRDAIRLARTNNLSIHINDFLFCLIYGEPSQKNSFIKQVEKDYLVVIGKEFWYRFTGDLNFYNDLIKSIGEVANEFNMKKMVKKVIKELASEIRSKHNIED
jgi:hypothetical protein